MITKKMFTLVQLQINHISKNRLKNSEKKCNCTDRERREGRERREERERRKEIEEKREERPLIRLTNLNQFLANN